MQTRVAVMAIIVEEMDAVDKLNATLHDFPRISSDGWEFRTKSAAYISYQSLWTHRRMRYPRLRGGSETWAV